MNPVRLLSLTGYKQKIVCNQICEDRLGEEV